MKKILYLTSYAETNTHGESPEHIFKVKKAIGVVVAKLWLTKEEVKHFESEGVEINITPYNGSIFVSRER